MADRVMREARAARCRRILAAQKVRCVRLKCVAPKGRKGNPRSTVSFPLCKGRSLMFIF